MPEFDYDAALIGPCETPEGFPDWAIARVLHGSPPLEKKIETDWRDWGTVALVRTVRQNLLPPGYLWIWVVVAYKPHGSDEWIAR